MLIYIITLFGIQARDDVTTQNRPDTSYTQHIEMNSVHNPGFSVEYKCKFSVNGHKCMKRFAFEALSKSAFTAN